MIYFDIAPAYGVMSGIVQIELGARVPQGRTEKDNHAKKDEALRFVVAPSERRMDLLTIYLNALE